MRYQECMDARGLVAVIVTVHELALALGGLVASFVGLVALLVFRAQPPLKRNVLAVTFALGCGALAYGLGARFSDVQPLTVEVVRVSP